MRNNEFPPINPLVDPFSSPGELHMKKVRPYTKHSGSGGKIVIVATKQQEVQELLAITVIRDDIRGIQSYTDCSDTKQDRMYGVISSNGAIINFVESTLQSQGYMKEPQTRNTTKASREILGKI